MRTAWRIVKEKHAATAFDGEGARLNGGRWNSKGTRVIYTSGSMALAALELLVHLNPPVTFRHVIVRVSIPDDLVETLPPVALPESWAKYPAPAATQLIGDRWAREGRSAVLELPSAIIPRESNFLLNPEHPDFGSIEIGEPERFSFDPRLL